MMDFKPIRNKIRTFTFDSLTNEILKILKEIEISKTVKYPFWHLLLLLKWNLEFQKKNFKTKKATRKDILNLLKELEKLEMSHDIFSPDFKGFEFTKVMTILSQQQFFYQNKAHWDTFARQIILYTELKSKYNITKAFKKITNVDLLIFLKISFIIYITSFIDSNQKARLKVKFNYEGFLTKEVGDLITTLFGEEILINYLKILTVSKENINTILKEDNRSLKNYNLQPFEVSFFTRKPFFYYNDQYLIPYKHILHHNFHYFIYEFLKIKDEKFTTELGLRLEKYVKLGLDEIKIKYQTENELKKILGIKSNLVDFVIDENILIEVKAIEIKPYVSINPHDKILANEFRKNLIKAYAKQMINVAQKLSYKKEYYGIIITYKKLFLGNSTNIWEQFLKEETLKIHSENYLKILPYKNLFFVDIESWDMLIQTVKDGNYSLVEILEKVKLEDSNPKSKKFNFSMHLKDEFNFQKFDLSYLLNTHNKMKINT